MRNSRLSIARYLSAAARGWASACRRLLVTVGGKPYPAYLLMLVVTVCLMACTADDYTEPEITDETGELAALSFNMNVRNTTRSAGSGTTRSAGSGTTRSADINTDEHYEFGAFTYGNNGAKTIMNNYLVAYVLPANQYGIYNNMTSSTTLDQSRWVYQNMGYGQRYTTNSTKSVQQAQVLKYWDKSLTNYLFVGYTPYINNKSNNKISFDASGKALTFTKLSSFYTSPVTQVGTAITKGVMTAASGYKSDQSIASDNDELINANEAMYAFTKAAKVTNEGLLPYGQKVPLDFRHINAKIQLAIYAADLPGYTYTITDMVPEGMTVGSGTYPKATQKGIVLTPATQTNTNGYVKQPTENTKFTTSGDVAVDFSGDSPSPSVSSPTKTNPNLVFQIPAGALSTTRASATTSATTYYALPADASDGCGFTAHVSYKLTAAKTGETTKVYDGRVWIPADACQWEAGKSYLYVLKLTQASTGTTDPEYADPITTTEPYIDPSDPRIIATDGLQPIVFDGIYVCDYDKVTNQEFIPYDATNDLALASFTTVNDVATDKYYQCAEVADGVYETVTSTLCYEYDGYTICSMISGFTATYHSDTQTFTVTETATGAHHDFLATTYTASEAYCYFWDTISGNAVKLTWSGSGTTAAFGISATFAGRAYAVYTKNQ